MTKRALIVIFSFIALSSYSQSILPDNFEIGDFIKIYNKDSIKIYFNCTGTITDKKCASFYRVGKIDSINVNVTGDFYDFDINGKLYLKATMVNNGIEGYAYYYYKSGKIKEEGNYNKNTRVGKWKYYYSNGEIEKIYSFDSEEPTVLEAYAKNGKATVINGNGKIHTEFSNYKQCSSFEVWGDLLNGKKNGVWEFSNMNASNPIASETYNEGVFIQGGNDGYVYTENPKIKLTQFYPNENLNLVDNLLGCPGDSNIFLCKYNDSSMTTSFYSKLQEVFSKKSVFIKNQWIIVGMKIGKDDAMSNLNVASSINDTSFENDIYSVIQNMLKWKSARINNKLIECDIYFSILVDNNNVIILPDYVYNSAGK